MTSDQLLSMNANDYMNDAQLAFFKTLLIEKKQSLYDRIEEYRAECSLDRQADTADSASGEEARETASRLIALDTLAISRIEAALQAIAEGSYGYCDSTGEEIGLKRLLLVPESLMSVEAMKNLERRSKHLRAA